MYEFAHERSEVPGLVENFVEITRLCEETQGQIGDGEVYDEDISRCPHRWIPGNHVAHETVSGCSERNKQGKDDNDRCLLSSNQQRDNR